MNFFKKLFVGLGWVFGAFCYGTLALIVSASRGRHRSRRHRHGNFWKMLGRMIVFNWIYEGVRKSRTHVETTYFHRTGQSLWSEPKREAVSGGEHRTTEWREKSKSAVAEAPKKTSPVRSQSKRPQSNGTSKTNVSENVHQQTVDAPAPVSMKKDTGEKKAQPSGTVEKTISANIPAPENEPKQKTAQEVEAERQVQMKNLRLALLEEVRAIHAAPLETMTTDSAQSSPEHQLSLLLYQPELPQKELENLLSQLRAERIRQQAAYQGAPFADVFPVSLILAEEDSERACIVDVGETGMSYVIPWSSIPEELREVLKRYVSEAGGKMLGYCKEELCNSSTNRMIVELYLGKQDGTASRILF